MYKVTNLLHIRKSSKLLTKFIIIIFWGIITAIVGFIIWKNHKILSIALQTANYSKIIYACGWYLLALFFAILVWIQIVKCFLAEIDWWTHARIYIITLVARRLPGTIWYIWGRVTFYKEIGASWVNVTIASGVEIIISLVTGIILGAVFIPFGLQLSLSLKIFISIIGFLCIIILHPNILSIIMEKFGRRLNKKPSYLQVLSWFFSHLCLRICTSFMVIEIIQSFQPLNYHEKFITMGAYAIATIIGMLALLLPSNFGLTEITFAGLISDITTLPMAAMIAIIIRLFTTFAELLFGALFYLLFNKSPKQLSQKFKIGNNFPNIKKYRD